MKSKGTLGLDADRPIDLVNFGRHTNGLETVVFYQPVAEIYRIVKKLDYVRKSAFPIDIILIANEKHFNEKINSFRSLVIVLMALLKNDIDKSILYGKKIYKQESIVKEFEISVDHFANILLK